MFTSNPAHISLIAAFYSAFAHHDAESMAQCYHPEVEYSDPVFGKLKGKQAVDMWKMLIQRSRGNLKIDFSDVIGDDATGSANWVAKYKFSQTGRDITNKIHAEFRFMDNLIIAHDDHFDLAKWSQQAFGWKGYLLGWTDFMQEKIRQQAKSSLKKWQEKNK
jgi:ketosteroid isomerase-like protein